MTAAEKLTADLTAHPSAALRIAAPSADIVNIPFNRTRRSKLNPRKYFAYEPLVQLAVSIFERTEFDAQGNVTRSGIEHNLLGRPDTAPEFDTEIAAGERRQRAVELLVQGLTVQVKTGVDANGRPIMGESFMQVPADYPMPFRITPMTDAELIEAATVENVMREEMTPMEEADAFMALIGAGRSVDYIATKYRMHPVTVEGRVQLASGLGREGRKALDAGEINLEHAKVIASTSGPLKKMLLDHACSGSSASSLKRLLEKASFPVSNALFDVEASGLAIDDSQGLGLLGDFPAQFKDPKAALSKQLEKLNEIKVEEEATGNWGAVEIVPVEGSLPDLPPVGFVFKPNGMKAHLLLICATKTGKVGRSEQKVSKAAADAFCHQEDEERKARMAAAAQNAGKSATPIAPTTANTSNAPQVAPTPLAPEPPKIREAAHVIAHQTRAQAIQGKLARDPKLCLALTCDALLKALSYGYGSKYLDVNASAPKTVPLTPEGLTLAAELAHTFGTLLVQEEGSGQLVSRRLGFDVFDELTDPKITEGDLLKLLAYLTHQQAGQWEHPQNRCPHRVQTLADKLGVTGDVQARFTLTAEYLDAYTSAGLHALIETMPEEHRPVGLFKASKKELVGLIVEKADALKKSGWLPDLVKFKA